MNDQNLTLASEQEDASKLTSPAKTTVVAPEKTTAGGKSTEPPVVPDAEEDVGVAAEEVELTDDEKQRARVPCLWTITSEESGIMARHQELGIVFTGTVAQFNKKFLKR